MLRKPELSTGPMGHLGPYKGFTVLCWFFFATILSSRDSLIQTVSLDLCIFIHGSSSIHSTDFLNMKQTFSALSHSTAPGNSYSVSRTLSPSSRSSSRVSYLLSNPVDLQHCPHETQHSS